MTNIRKKEKREVQKGKYLAKEWSFSVKQKAFMIIILSYIHNISIAFFH